MRINQPRRVQLRNSTPPPCFLDFLVSFDGSASTGRRAPQRLTYLRSKGDVLRRTEYRAGATNFLEMQYRIAGSWLDHTMLVNAFVDTRSAYKSLAPRTKVKCHTKEEYFSWSESATTVLRVVEPCEIVAPSRRHVGT